MTLEELLERKDELEAELYRYGELIASDDCLDDYSNEMIDAQIELDSIDAQLDAVAEVLG